MSSRFGAAQSFEPHRRVVLVGGMCLLCALSGCEGSVRQAPVPLPPEVLLQDAGIVEQPTVPTLEQHRRYEQLARQAKPFHGLHSHTQPWLAPDGRRLLFRSDRSDGEQLYLATVGEPGTSVRRLTRASGRIVSPRLTPRGDAVLYLADTYGDERFHLLRLGLDGSDPVDLTPGPPMMRRYGPLVPRAAADRVLFTALPEGQRKTLTLVQSLGAPGTATVFHDEAQLGSLQDVSPHGRRGLYVRSLSPSREQLLEIDVATGAATELYPRGPRAVAVAAAAYDAVARRVFVATDEGGESWSLLALDGKTAEPLGRYTDGALPSARIRELRVAPADGRLAVELDAGSFTEIRLLDSRTLEPLPALSWQRGERHLGNFTADGSLLTLEVSSTNRPPDVVLVEAATGVLHPWRLAPTATSALPPVDVAIQTTTAFDGLSISINVYLPSKSSEQLAPLPTVVALHGGPASSGRLGWDPVLRFFAWRGFAVVQPNLRGSRGFGRGFELADDRERRADVLRDLASVHGWLTKQSWCEPSRVALYGDSFGGTLTLLALARQPQLWRAGVDISGPTALGRVIAAAHPAVRPLLVAELGDPVADAEVLAAFSPLEQASRITAPVFVYQGANDPRVPREQADAMVGELRQRGVPVHYLVGGGDGHGVGVRSGLDLLLRVTVFLEERLAL